MQPGQQMTPEQQEALKQKLENMSPEELKEFQKKQCIFCQILSGKVPSKKIYEDETVMAILDINPANPGHILLLPKEHYAIMPQIPDNELGHLFMVAKALSQVLLKVLKAEGTNIFVANGLVAGQKAQHFMAHIIPRKEKDGVEIDFPEGILKEDEAKRLVNRLKPMIEKVLGKSQEEAKEEPSEAETEEEPEEQAEVEAEPKKGPQIYITSAKAKRFHILTCPFAAKIQKDKRLKFTKEEAETAGYKPCKCTGLLGKKPEKVGREAIDHPETIEEGPEEAGEEPKEGEELEEVEETEEGPEDEETEESKTDEEEPGDEKPEEGDEEEENSALDDISSLLTG